MQQENLFLRQKLSTQHGMALERQPGGYQGQYTGVVGFRSNVGHQSMQRLDILFLGRGSVMEEQDCDQS